MKIFNKSKKSLIILTSLILVLMPTIVSAQSTITTVITKIGGILKAVVPVLLTIGLIYFIWGVIKYVIADGEEGKKKGKETMIYGIIGFAVISSLWGLVAMVVEVLGGAGVAPQGQAGSCSLANSPDFQKLLGYLVCIMSNSIIPLIFTLAGVMFIWGVVKFFLINSDEEAKRTQGKQYMIWGIIALAVMLSVWGLVGILQSTFGIEINGGSVLPQVTPPH